MTDHVASHGNLSRRAFLLRGSGAAALGAASLAPRRARAQGKPGGVLTVASSALPPNIEPHMQGLDIFQRRKPLVYENLVWIDYGLEPKPELAERWEQRSPTEYVFHLRRGVRFHDGKEMDAEDVKYTYDRVRDPKVSPGANDLIFVKQIDAVDKYTVRFVLSEPGGDLPRQRRREVQRRDPEGLGRRRQGSPHEGHRHRPLHGRRVRPEPALGPQAESGLLGGAEAAARRDRLPGDPGRVLHRGGPADGPGALRRVLLGAVLPGREGHRHDRRGAGAVDTVGGSRPCWRPGADLEAGGPPSDRPRPRPPGHPPDRRLRPRSAARGAAAGPPVLGRARGRSSRTSSATWRGRRRSSSRPGTAAGSP